MAYRRDDVGRAVWVADEHVDECMLCRTGFGLFTRRHHCRCCGRLLCSSCSSNLGQAPGYRGEFVRVCGPCFNSLASDKVPDALLGRMRAELSPPKRLARARAGTVLDPATLGSPIAGTVLDPATLGSPIAGTARRSGGVARAAIAAAAVATPVDVHVDEEGDVFHDAPMEADEDNGEGGDGGPAGLAANLDALEAAKDELSGSWAVEDSENLDGLLTFLGVGWLLRKAAAAMNRAYVLSYDRETRAMTFINKQGPMQEPQTYVVGAPPVIFVNHKGDRVWVSQEWLGDARTPDAVIGDDAEAEVADDGSCQDLPTARELALTMEAPAGGGPTLLEVRCSTDANIYILLTKQVTDDGSMLIVRSMRRHATHETVEVVQRDWCRRADQ